MPRMPGKSTLPEGKVMSSSNIKELFKHQGHRLGLVYYGDNLEDSWSTTLECLDCGEVVLEFFEDNGVIELGPKDGHIFASQIAKTLLRRDDEIRPKRNEG